MQCNSNAEIGLNIIVYFVVIGRQLLQKKFQGGTRSKERGRLGGGVLTSKKGKRLP